MVANDAEDGYEVGYEGAPAKPCTVFSDRLGLDLKTLREKTKSLALKRTESVTAQSDAAPPPRPPKAASVTLVRIDRVTSLMCIYRTMQHHHHAPRSQVQR